MHIRYGYRLDILCETATPIITMLDVHPSLRSEITAPDMMVARSALHVRETVDFTEYFDAFGNICRRLVAPAGGVILRAKGIIHHSGFLEDRDSMASAAPPDVLQVDLLPYLSGSRYCETDKLAGEAWQKFGQIEAGWAKVEAICDFVHRHIRFNYRLARSTRSAFEVFNEEVGVCRDYAHLAITLCRCMNIPARYCTGYLPDIGVEPDENPEDFSAWFEVFLGERWWTFDARHNIPRIGHVLIARGRDAADVPFVNSFGLHRLGTFRVMAEEVEGARFPVTSLARREHGEALRLISSSD
ncbi:MAG: transglutaminase [Rhizobiales bacterium PAR1]|nr:MAG: transglutaminase [Rhizobiales bacterium PAR1]